MTEENCQVNNENNVVEEVDNKENVVEEEKQVRKYDNEITKLMLKALVQDRHNSVNFLCFPELLLGTSRASQGKYKNNNKGIDLFVIDLFKSHDNVTYSYELKSLRDDYLKEMKYPLKRRMAYLLSNYFFFVIPAGMNVAKKEEIPSDCGLIEITADGKSHVILPAEYHSRIYPNWMFLTSFARRVKKLEMDMETYDQEFEGMNSEKIDIFLNEYDKI